jgi:hypothetical protein
LKLLQKHIRNKPFKQNKTQRNSTVFGSQEEYTYWTTAAGRRMSLQTSMDREVSRGQRGFSHNH